MITHFENVKTGRRYKVIEWNEDYTKVTLEGPNGGRFTEEFSKERFKKMGYRPVAQQQVA